MTKVIDMKSFIVTGASASGKTTLINEAIKNGYFHLSTHTTRAPRTGEIAGIHNEYLNFYTFKQNFKKNMYFEPSLNYAEKNGEYYGTPRNWVDYLKGDNYCATPITPLIADMIYSQTSVLWISLICDDSVRKARLISRGISSQEIEVRLNTAEEQYNLSPKVTIFNTTFLSPSDIFAAIRELSNV